MPWFFGCSLAIAAVVFTGGCSGPEDSASGVVRFTDGQPVQSGSIEFRSVDNGSRYAGRIASDGSFSLTDQNGEPRCPPGEYEVVVVQIVLTEDLAADAHEHGRTVPRHYADYYTSGLRATKRKNSTVPLVITLGFSEE